jgi:hypothetical protein
MVSLLRLAQSPAIVALVVAQQQQPPPPSGADRLPERSVRRLQGSESGFPAGWNGEAASPPMLWRHYSGCMHAGLPGDNSSCPGHPPGRGSDLDRGTAGKGCSSCNSWAAAINHQSHHCQELDHAWQQQQRSLLSRRRRILAG